ncbi:MAG TPA: hypothetical protein DCG75_10455 [Bacteroidales bacterium]|jgi:hypothetical protein|nr:hypothetical protein [Bacteroidales bacterium]
MSRNSDKVGPKFYIWFLGILFAASLITNLFLLRGESEGMITQQKLQETNAQIAQKLQMAKNEMNKFRGVSTKMDEVVKDATQKLEEKERKIRVLLNDKKLKEAESQRLLHEIDSIREKYVDVIDSLFIARQLNKTLNGTINFMVNRIDELSTKLGYASRLDIDGLTVNPLKKSFANKEMQTAIAKRTIKIKICFDVMDNKVTDPGMKDFYIRILSPDAEVLSDSDAPLTFIHPEFKQKVVYSQQETVNYKNQKINVCSNWAGTENYKPGLYIVEVFTKENKLGMTTFTLK